MSQFQGTLIEDTIRLETLEDTDQLRFQDHRELDRHQETQDIGQLQLLEDRAQDQLQLLEDQAQGPRHHREDQALDQLLEVRVTILQETVEDLLEEVFQQEEEEGAKRHHFMGTLCPHNASHGASWPLRQLKDYP